MEPIPELVRLGEQLAQARERSGLSPEALARRLRVEPRLLQALEQGDHSQLPEGVFIVALARRVAGALQINVDESIAAVRQSRLMLHRPATRAPQPPSASQRPQPRPPAPRSSSRRPSSPGTIPSGWRWPLAGLVTLCGAAAAWFLLPQPRMPVRGPSSPPQAAPQTETTGSIGTKTAPSTTSPVPTPTPPAALSDTLRLQAREPSWVEVRNAAGQTLFEGTLTGEKSFPLGTGLEVIAGRPYAVTAAIGQDSGSPLGGVADIRWKRFAPGSPTQGALTPAAPPSSPPAP